MTWMLTASGQAFDLRFIDRAAIDIRDVAHHLAQINRYTGACSRPYSVAEHSLFVSWILEHENNEHNPSVLMAALLHDAHEAYTTDLSSPMKRVIGPAWKMEEDRIQRAVLGAFHLTTAWATCATVVHWADETALLTEREQLLPAGGPAWPDHYRARPLPESTWCFADMDDWTWSEWRDAFLERYAELHYARQQAALQLHGHVVPITAGKGVR